MKARPEFQKPPSLADRRWEAVCRHDPSWDGRFVYSVATTGIYCRPSCPARRPHRENVGFHRDAAAAERKGFRPCKRCRPDGPSMQQRRIAAVERACRLLDDAEITPSLHDLAVAAGLSRYHFHRIFKDIVGLTPRQYAAARRDQRVRKALRSGPSVTEAIYASGFNSGSRFYEQALGRLGMTPHEFRTGGRGISMRFAIVRCPLGWILVAGTSRGVCSVRLGDDRGALEQALRQELPSASFLPPDRAFRTWVRAVVDRIRHPASGRDVPFDIRGTAFQHTVWRALQEIPPGETVSYLELARRIGRPAAVRAVARGCATNPLAILIPCHRVLGKNGNLSGYRWGLSRKEWLLRHESRLR